MRITRYIFVVCSITLLGCSANDERPVNEPSPEIMAIFHSPSLSQEEYQSALDKEILEIERKNKIQDDKNERDRQIVDAHIRDYLAGRTVSKDIDFNEFPLLKESKLRAIKSIHNELNDKYTKSIFVGVDWYCNNGSSTSVKVVFSIDHGDVYYTYSMGKRRGEWHMSQISECDKFNEDGKQYCRAAVFEY